MTMDRHINSIKTATPASLAPVDKLPHYVRCSAPFSRSSLRH